MNTLNVPTNTDIAPNSKSNSPEQIVTSPENELTTAIEKNSDASLQADVYTKSNLNEKAEQEPEEKLSSQEDLTQEQLGNMAQSLQSFVESLNKSIEFSVDDDSKRNVITVKDALSGDIIRQIPSQEMLDLIKSLGKTTGILFNEDV